MGTPPGCEQTNKVKLLPSRRTTYTGGNKVNAVAIVNLAYFFSFFHS